VAVTDGLFTVQLEFGAAAFQGNARWLAIAVRCSGDTAYTDLPPRQALTAAPYASYALSSPWSGLSGVPAGFAGGVDDDTTYTAGTGLLTLSSGQFGLDVPYRPAANLRQWSTAQVEWLSLGLRGRHRWRWRHHRRQRWYRASGGATSGNVSLSADTNVLHRGVTLLPPQPPKKPTPPTTN